MRHDEHQRVYHQIYTINLWFIKSSTISFLVFHASSLGKSNNVNCTSLDKIDNTEKKIMRFRFFAPEHFFVSFLSSSFFFFCETFKKLVLEPQLLSRVCNFLRIFILCFQLSSIHRYISRRCRSNDFIWSIYRSQGRVELVKRAPWRFSDDVRAELKLTIISF